MTKTIFGYYLPAFCGLLAFSMLTACGGGSASTKNNSTPNLVAASSALSLSSSSSSFNSNAAVSSSAALSSSISTKIRLNQLGFLPNAQKIVVVPEVTATSFSILDNNNVEVFSDNLSSSATWEPAQESVKLADFSALTTPGTYKIHIVGVDDQPIFNISDTAYNALNSGAVKAYYFNRASTALLTANAGIYARAAGHPDNIVKVHASAATLLRPEGTIISAPKGWYDAGDYNKYIVNSGITTFTLLSAFEKFPAYFIAENNNIPESGNGVPDILNEAMWNIEWMLAMQDPNDGGVYHKLTSKAFSGFVMPDKDTSERFVVQKTTAATLDFAAVMAIASRVYANYDSNFPGLSAKMLAASKSAYAWARLNPAIYYAQPSDIQTGEYNDNDVSDELEWASAELYISTHDDTYYPTINLTHLNANIPGWGSVQSLALISMAHNINNLTNIANTALIKTKMTALANNLVAKKEASAFGVSMEKADLYWGSNSVAMNEAMMLLEAYQLDNTKKAYVDAAQSLFDYVMGRNPTGYSFVTGFGTLSPLHIHHRISSSDGIDAPIPGFLVSGPNKDSLSDCGVANYPSPIIAKSYYDNECSYSTNEIAINWNAPLVYVSAGLQVLTER